MARLEVNRLSKQYGSVAALDDVSLSLESGAIHAIVGENGAGKSTLVSVLAGFVRPDSGTVRLDDRPLPLGRPFLCRQAGVEMIHQHFTLVPAFSVAENLALARIEQPLRTLDLKLLVAPALAIAEELGWEIDPSALIRDLPVGVQQRVEILKALSRPGVAVLFDEPTAVLTELEIEDLFRVLQQLKAKGRVVVLIAHKISEILRVADRISVLRNGRLVADVARHEATAEQIAEWMTGEAVPEAPATVRAEGEVVLQATGLYARGDRGEMAVGGVSFDLRSGEIASFGGVDGNGQVELAEVLAGIRPSAGGVLGLVGDPECAYIPQDRQADGLAMRMSVGDNLLMGGFRRADLAFGPFLSPSRVRSWADGLIRKFSIKVEYPADPIAALSGGNQQKVILSRTLDRTPKLLIAVNPTRGLDVRATAYVHSKIIAAAAEGAAVALFSTDHDELSAMASTVRIMSRGRFVDSYAGADGS